MAVDLVIEALASEAGVRGSTLTGVQFGLCGLEAVLGLFWQMSNPFQFAISPMHFPDT